ncbi:MAG: bifunctional folylpolyglutamate synthase/dihydrofolate synthase [Acidimicrobiales bacterium]
MDGEGRSGPVSNGIGSRDRAANPSRAATLGAGAELVWLADHVDRETGVGIARGRAHEPPDRRVFDELLGRLGRPDCRFATILIAGTNAKTTTAWATAAVLSEAGYRVGTYTSPHLQSICERVAVNGASVGEDQLCTALGAVAAVEEELSGPLSWFEIMTAAAFAHFARHRVEVAVVETGLGGEFDATAALHPVVTVVTNIDLDHTDQFGPTRADVARAEASIVRPDTTLLLGEADPDLRGTLTARTLRPALITGEDYAIRHLQRIPSGFTFGVDTPTSRYQDLRTRLQGRHQPQALATAIVAAELFAGPLDPAAVRRSLEQLGSPGRFEVRHGDPTIVLDGAHNPAGARSLASSLNDSFPSRSRLLVVGLSIDKPAVGIIGDLDAATAAIVACCAARTPRARPAAQVANAAWAAHVPPERTVVCPSVVEAIQYALHAARPEDIVVVTGSLYVVGEARAWLDSGQTNES